MRGCARRWQPITPELRGVAPPAVSMGHIFMAVVPYVVMSLILLAAVFWIPEIATWLPRLIG